MTKTNKKKIPLISKIRNYFIAGVVVLVPSPMTKSDAIANSAGVIFDLSFSGENSLALPESK